MATNPIGPGTANASVNLPKAEYLRLKELAKLHHMTWSAYLRWVLSQAK